MLQTVTGARKSRSSQQGDVVKSHQLGRLGSSADVLHAHSFEVAQGGHGFTEFHSGAHPGHVFKVNDATQEWTHTKGARTIESSNRDAEPAECAAHLHHHLMEFKRPTGR